MHRLAPEQFPHNARSLFSPDLPDRPVLFSVLEGRNPGMLYVDDPLRPSWAIAKAPWFCLLIGGTPPVQAVEQLTERLQHGTVIGPGQDRYRNAVRPQGMMMPRLEFSGPLPCDLAALCSAIPADVSIRPIDAEILPRCLWKEDYLQLCGSAENFLRHGLGYVLMAGEEILSEASTCHIGAGEAEIGAITAEKHRGKGYAAVVTAHLIRACEYRGLTTVWSCDRDHRASVSVAEKLGYAARREYMHVYSVKG